MRNLLILAAAGSLYAISAATASATCLSGSLDASNNAVEIIDLGCEGVATPNDKPIARMQGGFYPKSDKRLAAEADVQARIAQMVEADPPAEAIPSLLSWLIGAMFGQGDVKVVPDHAVIDKSADRKAADKATPSGAADLGPSSKQKAPADRDDDLFCLIEVNGQGSMKEVGITVASNRKLRAKGLATVIIKGTNDVSTESDVVLNLNAGGSKSYPIIKTNGIEGAALTARLDIAGRQVICN